MTHTYEGQVILAIRDGKLFCEAPSGSNGARNAVDLEGFTVNDIPPPIVQALFRQALRRREAAAAAQAKDERAETERRRRMFAVGLSYEQRVLGEQKAEAAARAKSGKPNPKATSFRVANDAELADL
jgi:hypothetical protein